jgi:hypothetical protein
MPPPLAAEVVVAQLVPDEEVEPPEFDEHAARTMASAATTPVTTYARVALTCCLLKWMR